MFIASDLLPLSTVESVHFGHFIQKVDPRYQLPSRKHLTQKLLHSKMTSLHNSLCKELNQANHLAITIDLWSNRQMKAFLGITAHYIIDWEMKSAMLACRRMKGSHTSDNIYESFEETMASFHISGKLNAIVTDNAANMSKAFHVELQGFTRVEDLTEDDPSENEDIEDQAQPMMDGSVYEHFPEHHRCFSHTLQLVVKDGLKASEGQISKLIGKASKVVSQFRKSTQATDLLEGESKLQAANTTRWNSQVIMIKSLLKVPSEKLDQLDTVKLTGYERNCLSEVCEILKPFQTATDMVQGENSVTSSLVIPCIRGLQMKLVSLSAKYKSRLVTALKESVEKRLSAFEDDKSFILATVLDPRFKIRWCNDAAEVTKMKNVLLDNTEHLDHTISAVEVTSPPCK